MQGDRVLANLLPDWELMRSLLSACVKVVSMAALSMVMDHDLFQCGCPPRGGFFLISCLLAWSCPSSDHVCLFFVVFILWEALCATSIHEKCHGNKVWCDLISICSLKKNKVWWNSKPDTAVIFWNIRQWFVTAQHDGHLIRPPFQNEYSIFLHISSSQLTVAYCKAWKFYLCTVSAACGALFLCWSQLRLPAGLRLWCLCGPIAGREPSLGQPAPFHMQADLQWDFVCVCHLFNTLHAAYLTQPRFCLKQVQIV